MAPCNQAIRVSALQAAARRPEVVEAMEAFYVEAGRRIAEHGATCLNRGLCCRFGEFGHRLYVTALEVAYYLAGVERTGGVVPPADDACPHQRDGRCHVRECRPLGCRIFYCDPAARPWQGPLTEELHARLRAMHDELGVPYFYADWMTVLQALARPD